MKAVLQSESRTPGIRHHSVAFSPEYYRVFNFGHSFSGIYFHVSLRHMMEWTEDPDITWDFLRYG